MQVLIDIPVVCHPDMMCPGKIQISIWLVLAVDDHGYEPMYGARPLKRYLQKSVETLAARLILSDGVDAEDTILIDVENDQLIAKVKF